MHFPKDQTNNVGRTQDQQQLQQLHQEGTSQGTQSHTANNNSSNIALPPAPTYFSTALSTSPFFGPIANPSQLDLSQHYQYQYSQQQHQQQQQQHSSNSSLSRTAAEELQGPRKTPKLHRGQSSSSTITEQPPDPNPNHHQPLDITATAAALASIFGSDSSNNSDDDAGLALAAAAAANTVTAHRNNRRSSSTIIMDSLELDMMRDLNAATTTTATTTAATLAATEASREGSMGTTTATTQDQEETQVSAGTAKASSSTTTTMASAASIQQSQGQGGSNSAASSSMSDPLNSLMSATNQGTIMPPHSAASHPSLSSMTLAPAPANSSMMMPPPPSQQQQSGGASSSLPTYLTSTSSHQQHASMLPPQQRMLSQPAARHQHSASLSTSTFLTQGQHAPHAPSSPDAIHCTICSFPGADLRIKGPCSCAYHARCVDLVGLCNNYSTAGNSGVRKTKDDNIVITTCPNCRGQADGVEILPLSFLELDRSQRQVRQKKGLLLGALSGTLNNNTGAQDVSMGGGASGMGGELSKKRSSSDLESTSAVGGVGGAAVGLPSNIANACRATNINTASTASTATAASSNASNQYTLSTTSQCYDPAVPRTGRWTDEELAFRDAIIAHFLSGSLPLSNGLKLNDFLSNMLKSKQSRLTKKMKHAKLSTKYFRIKSGHVTPALQAKEFSSLEYNFVNVIADPIERSEIAFHMQREWRDHLAERLTYLRISFDADEWLKSVDTMDRRVALEKNRSRMVKRRCLMGKAMEKDISESIPGVFINREQDRGEDFLLDMEEKQGQLTASGLGMGGGSLAGMGMSPNMIGKDGTSNMGNAEEDGDFGRFLMSMLDEAPIAAASPAIGSSSHHHHPSLSGNGGKKNATLRSSCDPNFRYAAPFLAGITSYVERNGVPFEHVDIWVPSSVPRALEGEQSAPLVGSMGSGSNANLMSMGSAGSGTNLAGTSGSGNTSENMESGDNNNEVCRLCFAGSATLGVQIIDEYADTGAPSKASDKKTEVAKKIVPLTGDEIFNFSLYGDYSEKFSFSSGCGLPGRVFESGVAAWEQFLPNAPPEMFERRGGAIQFGIKTALGLPIESPNVGRIVVVLYSMHNREKDEELVNRIVKDIRLFNPCPRWKLVVDVRSSSSTTHGRGPGASPVIGHPPPPPAPPMIHHAVTGSNSSFSAGMSSLSMQSIAAAAPLGMDLGDGSAQYQQNAPQAGGISKNNQIINLIALLQENMPSDQTSILGKQLNSIMSLRMILLRPNRSPEEEQLVETILVLYESYQAAGRTRADIALLVTRDYDFHIQHQQRMSMLGGSGGHHQAPQGGDISMAPPPPAVGMSVSPLMTQQHAQQHMMYNAPAPGTHHTLGVHPGDSSQSFIPHHPGMPGVLQNVVHAFPGMYQQPPMSIPAQLQHPAATGVPSPKNLGSPSPTQGSNS